MVYLFLSVFDIFKVGVGPSSSHTNGPMVATSLFLNFINNRSNIIPGSKSFFRITCTLYGSLSFTGKGHHTDKAILHGMAGIIPSTYNEKIGVEIDKEISNYDHITVKGFPEIKFYPNRDIIFNYGPALKQHANGMIFSVYDRDENLCTTQTYFSVGGGFIKTIKELENPSDVEIDKKVPYPFSTADEMLDLSKKNKISISEMKRQNELVFISEEKLKKGISELWNTMSNSINSGLKRDGILPGGLNVRRRAKSIFDSLNSEIGSNTIAPHIINDWISLYAMAVNEENAAGGKIVTAPTNGAAGVIPATFMYYLNHVPNADPKKIEDYLLTAAAIGGILKSNASISGAEVGCQGEVGSASAMAAGALCAILGGNSLQIENAAEIALEHHLGMTCDPIKGLVQAPCIERNGLGAIKAVSAASLSLRGDGIHLVSLDACIKTMFETGKDMMEKYKETSKGGLAVNVIEC